MYFIKKNILAIMFFLMLVLLLATDVVFVGAEMASKTDFIIRALINICIVVGTMCVINYITVENFQKRAKRSERKYQKLIENVQAGITTAWVEKNACDFKIEFINEEMLNLYGCDTKEEYLNAVKKYKTLIHPEDADKTRKLVRKQMQTNQTAVTEYRSICKDGRYIWVLEKSVVIEKLDDKLLIQSVIIDITSRKEREQQFKLDQDRFRIAASFSDAMIFDYDVKAQKYITIFNSESFLGFTEKELIDRMEAVAEKATLKNIEDQAYTAKVYHSEDLKTVCETIGNCYTQGTASCKVRMLAKNGEYLWVKIEYILLLDNENEPKHILGIIKNITEIVALKAEAQCDPITNVFNKTNIARSVANILKQSSVQKHAMFVLDVDNFKTINDSQGHLFGDAVLIDITSKLKQLLRENDLIGRVGGDEFVAIMKNVKNIEVANSKAAEICDAIKTITYNQNHLKISCSIGVAISEPQQEYETLFSNADKALYKAKKQGTYCTYTGAEQMQAKTGNAPITSEGNRKLDIKERIFEILYSDSNFETGVNLCMSLIVKNLTLVVRMFLKMMIKNKLPLILLNGATAIFNQKKKIFKIYHLQLSKAFMTKTGYFIATIQLNLQI